MVRLHKAVYPDSLPRGTFVSKANYPLAALACLFALLTPAPAAAQTTPAEFPYRNASLGAEQRAADLVSRMTLEEKARQLGHTAPAIPRLGVPEYNWWNEGL